MNGFRYNLEKILPYDLKEQIDNAVSEYVGGGEYEILYGGVFIQMAAPEKEIIADIIIRTVCESFNVQREIVLGKTRKIPLVTYRQYITYFLGQYLEIGLREVGRYTDNKHSNVLHSNKVVENYICTNKHRREEIQRIKNKLNILLWEK